MKAAHSSRSSPAFPPRPALCGRGESLSCFFGHLFFFPNASHHCDHSIPMICTPVWKPVAGVHASTFSRRVISCVLFYVPASWFPDKILFNQLTICCEEDVYPSDLLTVLPPTLLPCPYHIFLVPGSVKGTLWVSDVYGGHSHVFPVCICVDSGSMKDVLASQLFISSRITSAESPDSLQQYLLDTGVAMSSKS